MIDIMSILIKYGALVIVLLAIGAGIYYWYSFTKKQRQEDAIDRRDSDDYFVTGHPLVGEDYDTT